MGAPSHCTTCPTKRSERSEAASYIQVVAGRNATPLHAAVFQPAPPITSPGQYDPFSNASSLPLLTPPNAAADNPPNSANIDEADEGSPSLLSLPASIDGPDSTSLVRDEPAAIDSTLVTLSALFASAQCDLAATQQLMFSKLQLHTMATQQRMFSKLKTKLLSTLVTMDALVRTDANIRELQASVKTLTECDSKRSSMLENVGSNLLHATQKVLPVLSTNLTMLQADYYGRLLTSKPLQNSHNFTPSSSPPSAVGNKTPTGQLDSRLADLNCLLDSHLPPVAPLRKDPHSAFKTEIKLFICLVGTTVSFM
jgi:hypothetical protein